MSESNDIQSAPQLVAAPRKRRGLRVFLVVLMSIASVLLALVIALAANSMFRLEVRPIVGQLFGVSFAQSFDQFFAQLGASVASWWANLTSAFSAWWAQVSPQIVAWWNALTSAVASRLESLHLDEGYNNFMTSLFGPNAPTTDKIASLLPSWPTTGDPIADFMVTLIVICIPIIIILWIMIRRRDAAYDRGELPKRRRWWVWLLTLVSLVAMVATASVAFMTGYPGWAILFFMLLGFTAKTFQADI